jgi:very-short-patch-repair endonuclease
MNKLVTTLKILAPDFSPNKTLKNNKKEELATIINNIQQLNDNRVDGTDLMNIIKILHKKSTSKKDKEDIELGIKNILSNIDDKITKNNIVDAVDTIGSVNSVVDISDSDNAIDFNNQIIDVNHVTDLSIVEEQLDSKVSQYNKYTKTNPMLGVMWNKSKQKWRLQYNKINTDSKVMQKLCDKMLKILPPKNLIIVDLKLHINYSDKLISYKYLNHELFDIRHILSLFEVSQIDVKYAEFKNKITHCGFKQNKHRGYILRKLISLNTVKEIIYRSRQSVRPTIAKILNINILNEIYLCKEEKYINKILEVFKNESMDCQYYKDNYRVDLYFIKYKIAIECDEYNHADRNINYEKKRETYLRKHLNCDFIRFNPDDPEFDIFKLLNTIYIMIIKKLHTL